ncbi:MAG TPA: 50S ribosomal protein L24 [Acidimicrobiia bacterium]|nr:50S ribosomal protein L24 [Acidimicrobiia bacterium]
MKMRLKKGDRVQVIQGKDIGKVGEVARVIPDRNMVVVESAELINVSKKHQKPTRATMQGGIQDKAMPIHVSNLMIMCSKDGPVKIGYRVEADGTKTRVCRKCGAVL